MARASGEGTLRKRTRTNPDGSKTVRWHARISVFDPETGKRRRIDGPARRTQREANEDRRELAARYGSITTSVSVAQFAPYWLEQHRHQISELSLSLYERTLRLHIIPHLGDYRLEQLTPLILQRWQTTIITTKSPNLAISARACLSAMLTAAVQWQLIPNHPLTVVPRPKMQKREYTWWEPDEAKRFLATAKPNRYYLAYYLLLTLGLRLGEMRALQWKDISNNALHVQRAIWHNSKSFNPEYTLPKHGGSRTIVLPEDVLALLAEHRRKQDKLREHYAADLDLIIAEPDGLLTTSVNVRRVFHNLCREAGVPVIRLHDLRHTAASLWIAAGLDLPTISARLGHADSTITQRIYLHALRSRHERPALTMAEMLDHK